MEHTSLSMGSCFLLSFGSRPCSRSATSHSGEYATKLRRGANLSSEERSHDGYLSYTIFLVALDADGDELPGT